MRMEPEEAHERALRALEFAAERPWAARRLASRLSLQDPALETEVAGLRFPNPVGLAAGFDKDCRLAGAWHLLGFGFAELGTLTPRPQTGNPPPRLHRIPEAKALINRMGFNNEGAAAAAARLRAAGERPIPIGVNIGINADVKKDDAPEEYAKAFMKLLLHGDYFTINVSSPNTAGLRGLQDKLHLEHILTRIAELNADKKPIFVKLSPDLEPKALDALLPVLERCASGVVATNTTLSREGLCEGHAPGGLSGGPLAERSTRMIREIYRRTGGRLPIIGVGGIDSPEEAYRKIRAGASLVQVYTGLVYRGPSLPSDINRGLLRLLKEHGLSDIREAVGRSHRFPLASVPTEEPA